MIEIISIEKAEKWDEVVKSFSQYDVYYLSGYVKAFQLHGDGKPLLFYYKRDDLHGICVMMKRDISKSNHFRNILPENTLFDIVTPYGYGGFLFEGNTSVENMVEFDREYSELLNSENIISVFVRFHPQLNNADVVRPVSNVIDLGKTIEMDVTSEKIIWDNISSKNRNVIRRAEKNGVVIKQGRSMDLFDKFIDIYNRTMEKDNAESYYFFSRDFYQSIHTDLYDNYEMYYAEYNGEIIAMSIMLFANGRIHYHLSGSVLEYRHLAPSNLLLYKVALWGAEHGYKTFHLGGGVGSGEDGLFKFKKAFNRNSGLQFSIGKKIYNQEKYDALVAMRQKDNSEFDVHSSYFPLYRA